MAARIGVCSWSLRPSTPEELVERVRAAGLACVQLALDPLRVGSWSLDRTRDVLAAARIEICSGMMGMKGEDYSTLASIRATGGVRPDEHWEENRRAASEDARLARALGLELVSFHAGFLPEDGPGERAKFLVRTREIVDRFAEHGVRCAFETGQESATALLCFLEELDRPGTGVNFDPANMILYGSGEPVAALEALASWVLQVHVKDARRARVPGTWGEEVPAGTGEVDWERFFDVVHAREIDVDYVIERESGGERLADVVRARGLVSERLSARGLSR